MKQIKKCKDNVTLNNVYEDYVKLGGTLDKDKYRVICDKLFKAISNEILEGGTYHIGKGLGSIMIKRFKKKFKINEMGNICNGVVNWKESNELKEKLLAEGKELWNNITKTGHKWIIYYDDEWNYRWAWIKNKNQCTIKNNTVYSFTPTTDNTYKGADTKLGNKGKLKKLLRENPNQYLKYIHNEK